MKKIAILVFILSTTCAHVYAQDPILKVEIWDDETQSTKYYNANLGTIEHFTMDKAEDAEIHGTISNQDPYELVINSEVKQMTNSSQYLLVGTQPGLTLENAEAKYYINPKKVENFKLKGEYKTGNTTNGYHAARSNREIEFVEETPFALNTTYYYRFVLELHTTHSGDFVYYGKEDSFTTAYPIQMAYDNSGLEGGYYACLDKYVVFKYDDFLARNASFVGTDPSENTKVVLRESWLKIATEALFKDMPYIETTEGPLYHLDVVSGEKEIIADIQEKVSNSMGQIAIMESGFTASSNSVGVSVTVKAIQCDEKWNVPNNEYAEFTPTRMTDGYCITIPLPILLPTKTYRISLITAPCTNLDQLEEGSAQYKRAIRPNKISFVVQADAINLNKMQYGTNRLEIVSTETQTTTLGDFVFPTLSNKNKIQIYNSITASEANKCQGTLRIAGIIIEEIN